jgi:hypothetical protein
MADSSHGERVGRDEITQLPATARPPSAGSSASHQPRSAVSTPQTPRRPPSIRIQRLPSTPAIPQLNGPGSSDDPSDHEGERTGRRRAASAPMRPNLPPNLIRQGTATGTHLPSLTEESSAPQLHPNAPPPTIDGHLAPPAAPVGRMRSGSLRLRRIGSNLGARLGPPPALPADEYESEIVDMLDVVGV